MSKKLLKTKVQSGFTIIEVMIVLAIAGLILSVVLIAVPQLNKSQRNEARKSTLARISTELGNYSGNNNGKIPVSSAIGLEGFTERYLDEVSIDDPSTGDPFAIEAASGTLTATEVAVVADDSLGIAYYATGLSCDGEFLADGTARSYALWTGLEGGAIYCLDNL